MPRGAASDASQRERHTYNADGHPSSPTAAQCLPHEEPHCAANGVDDDGAEGQRLLTVRDVISSHVELQEKKTRKQRSSSNREGSSPRAITAPEKVPGPTRSRELTLLPPLRASNAPGESPRVGSPATKQSLPASPQGSVPRREAGYCSEAAEHSPAANHRGDRVSSSPQNTKSRVSLPPYVTSGMQPQMEKQCSTPMSQRSHNVGLRGSPSSARSPSEPMGLPSSPRAKRTPSARQRDGSRLESNAVTVTPSPSRPAWGSLSPPPSQFVTREGLRSLPLKKVSRFDLLSRGKSPAARSSSRKRKTDSALIHYNPLVRCDSVGRERSGPDKGRSPAVPLESEGEPLDGLDEFVLELQGALGKADFRRAREQQAAGPTSTSNKELRMVRRVFRQIADNEGRLDDAGMQSLLLLFTPPGVSHLEAARFFSEECDGVCPMGVDQFLHYGPQVRDRVLAYNRFAPLTDFEKLLAIATRIGVSDPQQYTFEVLRLKLTQAAAVGTHRGHSSSSAPQSPSVVINVGGSPSSTSWTTKLPGKGVEASRHAAEGGHDTTSDGSAERRASDPINESPMKPLRLYERQFLGELNVKLSHSTRKSLQLCRSMTPSEIMLGGSSRGSSCASAPESPHRPLRHFLGVTATRATKSGASRTGNGSPLTPREPRGMVEGEPEGSDTSLTMEFKKYEPPPRSPKSVHASRSPRSDGRRHPGVNPELQPGAEERLLRSPQAERLAASSSKSSEVGSCTRSTSKSTQRKRKGVSSAVVMMHDVYGTSPSRKARRARSGEVERSSSKSACRSVSAATSERRGTQAARSRPKDSRHSSGALASRPARSPGSGGVTCASQLDPQRASVLNPGELCVRVAVEHLRQSLRHMTDRSADSLLGGANTSPQKEPPPPQNHSVADDGDDEDDDDDGIKFNTDLDPEAELEEMQRQVNDLQEDLHLRMLNDSAAKDEGQRKMLMGVASGVGGQTTSLGGHPGSLAAAAGGASAATVTPGTAVFVGGMDPRTSEADLRLFFASCGAIKRITILKDRATGQPKGTAYLEFETVPCANAAILKDGQSLHGKPLKIALKRDNIPASQRGGLFRGAGFPMGRGRGAAAMQSQQLAMAAMMAMMTGGVGFSPFAAPRGRGRGRGRGA